MRPRDREPSICGMSTPVLAGKEVRTGPANVRPYLLGGLAAFSVGAAAIHFAVVFEHFAEYTLYGVFFSDDLVGPGDMARGPARAAVAAVAVAGHRRERHRYRGVRGVAHRRPPV